jgi:DHA1 family bicyclomycin/chloramphenicol resistance-like MFS transporter
MTNRPAPLALLLTVTLLFALQPLSTDFYLPSLPGIARYFATDVSQVQMTLTVFAMAFGIAQLLAGPLSDRFGRRPTGMLAAALYAFASVACALAPTLELLVLGRLFQAIGACMGLVNARAIVRDSFNPVDGARLIARSGSIMALAPLLGPIIGGLLEAQFGWRAAFVVLSCFGGLALWATASAIPETLAHPNPQALSPGPLVSTYWRVLRHRGFLAYTAAQAASYGGLFAFISGSSPVFQRVLGMGPRQFGLVFAVCVSGYLLGTLICRRSLKSRGIDATLQMAGLISVTSGAVMALLALVGVQHWLALAAPMFCYLIAHGLTTPCAQAGSVTSFGREAGSASGLMGFLQMVVASVVGLWMGASFNGTVLPLACTVAAGGLCLFLAVFLMVRRYGHDG